MLISSRWFWRRTIPSVASRTNEILGRQRKQAHYGTQAIALAAAFAATVRCAVLYRTRERLQTSFYSVTGGFNCGFATI